MRRFSFNQPNMRSWMFRSGISADQTNEVSPAWVCVSWIAEGLPAASGNGHSSASGLQHRSPRQPKASDSVCEDDRVNWGYRPRQAVAGHTEFRRPVRPKAKNADVYRWCRKAYESWSSGLRDYGLARDLRVRQALFSPAPDEARVRRTAVESIIHVSKSINPCSFRLMCSRLSIRLHAPWLRQSRNLW